MASEHSSSTPIGNPYPVPAVGTVSIQRRPGQSVGITVRKADENTVIVYRLTPDSLLHGTTIRVGNEILAINGEAVHTSRQATSIIKANTQLEFTTFDSRANKTPFCYVEVAPTSKINPGISFDSSNSRTMVGISDIFLSDLTKTRLKTGDIVLAVNGVPVWKPEQADKEQLGAARASKALILYCVDMDALRDYFTTKVKRTHYEGRTAVIQKKARGSYVIRERDCECVAIVNPETQLLDDETEWGNRIKTTGGQHTSKNLCKKISYSQVCLPTLNGLNTLMQGQLHRLKAKIVGHAWDYAIKTNADDIPTYAVPSAPLAPVEISSSGAAASSGSNIPLATAVAIDSDGEISV